MQDTCFSLFQTDVSLVFIPVDLNDPFEKSTPEICRIAATELQEFLIDNQEKWIHNFGTTVGKEGKIKGKMFGVLVVKNSKNELGFIAAFSGKLADKNADQRFVPSVFDDSSDDYFINRGMSEITHINKQIETMELSAEPADLNDALQLRVLRKIKSASLQQQLFDNYKLLNKSGRSKSITSIFESSGGRKPPSAAGECAAPKLLNYAFQNKMKPIAIAEFWWGQSTGSEIRKHKEFYPACNEKCLPILGFMLG